MPVTGSRLRREVVREVRRQVVGAGFGDDKQVLHAHPAALRVDRAGLDGDDVPGHERLPARAPERGGLVDLEADAVTEAEEEAVAQRLPGRLRALRGMPGGLEDIAGHAVD